MKGEVMEVVRIDEVPETPTPRKVEVRKVLKKEHVQVVYLKFLPGQRIPSHVTPVDVFFYVVEGRGSVTIGDVSAEVAEGDIVFSPKGIPHSVENASEGLLKLLVVKTPNPEKAE